MDQPVLPGGGRPPDAVARELSRNLRVDSVSRLGPTPALTLDADALVRAAVETMRAGRSGCLLVTSGGRLVGLFTERDLLTRVLAVGRSLDIPLREVMTPSPTTAEWHEPLRIAIRRMQEGGYRHLPIVDSTGRPVGVLSARQVVHYIVEHFPAVVFNQPPDPRQFPEAPEGA
ncbi:MAG: CBS domain-containing protein [Gemmataceae bacterium]|nr:CBS domain-containing protein [Gemmataceae bacterium]MDW8242373.1 CBS domain-containing protein [Thermogemmata sp.]